jgi:hypothetical protein
LSLTKEIVKVQYIHTIKIEKDMSNTGKYKKKQAVLEARRKAFDTQKNKQGYKRPGSQQGNW